MAIYNVAEYGVTGNVYGEAPKLQYYAEPFLSIATSYTQVQLTWIQPAGDYTELRVVRSNDGFPETSQDGAIIWEWNKLSGDTQITSFVDGNDPTKLLVAGKFVYYRIWVKLNNGAWKTVGDSYTLVPIRHATFAPDNTLLVDTKNKLMDVIPRVYTTATQSPIDEVDPNSDLGIFLDAFSFELDRALTYADLLLPLETWRFVGPDILALQSLQLGLPLEPYLATKQQRRLAREAKFIYSNKGTERGIGAFIESLTGFAPTVSASPNLVLTPQDSTFTEGVGFWRPVGNCTIESVNTVKGVSSSVEPYVVNSQYVGKVVSNEPGSKIINGADNPVTTGIPVQPGTAYNFSGYGKTAADTMGVTGYVNWYGLNGQFLEVDPARTFVQTPQVLTTSWTRFSFVGRSPGVQKPILAYSISSGKLTFYLDSPNIMVRGETIIVEGISATINGIYQIESVGHTPETINQINVATTQPNTTGSVICEGTFTEAYPTLGANLVVNSAEVENGVATIVFSANHGLATNDKIIVQGMSSYLSFGAHTILSAPNSTTVTFQIYEPYTGSINTTLDATYALGAGPESGGTWGFAKKIIPNTGTPAPKGYYASFEIVMANTGTMYLDLLQMATYDVSEYHEARAVEVFLESTNTNFLKNPGFNSAGSAQWSIVSNAASYVDRTTIGRVGAGQALEFKTDAPLTTSSYTVSSGVATVAVSTNTLTADDAVVILPPAYDYVIQAVVASGVATFTFAAPHGYSVGDSLLVTSTVPAFQTDFGGVRVVTAVGTLTVSFTTSVAPKTYTLSTTPYAAVAKHHPIYGTYELSAVGTGTISFPVTSTNITTPVTLVTSVGVANSLSTVSAPVKSGRFITASFYAKTKETNAVESLNFTTTASDVANPIAPVVVGTSSQTISVTNTWQRYSTTLFVPKVSPDTIVVSLVIGSIGTGKTIYFDHAQVESSYTATDYFDGAMPSAVSYGAVWEGTAHNSPTHLYPNLPVKITRLKQELPKYIPMNSDFLITWHGGGVAKPIV